MAAIIFEVKLSTSLFIKANLFPPLYAYRMQPLTSKIFDLRESLSKKAVSLFDSASTLLDLKAHSLWALINKNFSGCKFLRSG